MDSGSLTVLVLMGAVVLRVLLIATVVWWIIPRRRVCPHCSAPTFGLVSVGLAKQLRMERRWCPCGWAGWSKRVPPDGPGLHHDVDAMPATEPGTAPQRDSGQWHASG